MTIKIISALLISATLFIGSCRLNAQTPQTKQEKKAAEVKAKIKKLGTGERVRVKVKLNNDTRYEGYVSDAGDDAFTIVDKSGKPNSVSYSDVRSLGGKNLSTGAKIAIGVGIGAGVTLLVLFLVFEHITENN